MLSKQCITNKSIFRNIFLKQFLELENQKKENIKNSLKCLIYDLYKLLDSSENNPLFKNSLLYYSPNEFKINFNQKYPLFIRGQHDSMEFLRKLLNELIDDNNIIKVKYHEIKNDNKSKYKVIEEYKDFFKKREDSYIHELFYFQILSTYTCSCKYESYTCENLLEIPIMLLKEKEILELKDLLNNYFEKTEIEWNTKCWKCKKKF